MEYSFKIFGSGYLLKIANFNEDQMSLISELIQTKKLSLYEIIFDFEHLEKLGFSSWDDIPIKEIKTIVKINSGNKIEITAKAKRLLEKKTNCILDPNLLFPLFKLGESNFFKTNSPKRIVFGEEISGQIIHCRFSSQNFNAFDLKFDIIQENNLSNDFLFTDVYYNNQKLVSTSNQFLSRSFTAFFI